ncbi:hypothetical protein HPB49_002798 [Dermacentor silvarum]|uniref:Uncharacterized protein n=1 Tax=Dermacentor silvarum TaxID=543639 RepID=A0ACB8CP75_DERSI|nr:hypothetical protein HPB49_002798 [Dermacentor silvarum]
MRDGPKVKKNTQVDVEPQPVDPENARGYDSVRELAQPPPTERTLHRHLEGYKFTPGLLEDIMESLALKSSAVCIAELNLSTALVSLMSPEERHATLMLDEMQLAPGLVYNLSSGTVLGAQTIPLADATLPPDCVATHGLALFLEKYNFKFLLLSRFGQDALENLFSTLRCKIPVPRVLEFKFSLRAATMAQFLRPSKDGSYTEEDCFLLTGMADDNK